MIRWRQAMLLMAGWLLAGTTAAFAQDQPPAGEAPAGEASAEAASAEDAGTLVVTDEVRALVAPVALYPDPLLAVILQASLFPLDIVQADRFVGDYEQDQTLEPPEDWDPSVYALLGYPDLVGEMSEHLDWTEAMGDAVYDNLEDVQDSIQDLRIGAYSMGVLASNEFQEVVVEEQIVQIQPVSEDRIVVPDYDGFALVGALQPVEDEAAGELPEGIPPVPGSDETADQVDAVTAATVEEAETAEESGEADFVEADPASADAAYYDESAAYADPASTSYAQPPVYAAPPPAVAYSEPSSGSFWGSAGTFLGGAAVGGLLGYAIFDDDDNNDNDNNSRRNDVNIEDSTIIVGDQDRLNLSRDDRDRINSQLRDKRDRRDGGGRSERRRDRDRTVAALPDRRSAGQNRDRQRDIALPQRDRDKPARVKRSEKSGATAIKRPKSKKGGVADIKRPKQTKKDAQRGKKSRQKAALKKKAPQRQAARSGGGKKKKALAPKKGGKKKARAKSKRGKKSRGKKRRG